MWLSGGLGNAGLAAGLNDFGALFQPNLRGIF